MRLIDADALDYELGTSDRDIYVRECLAEAPSVTPEPHWIPVTERLPDDDTVVLACGNKGGIYTAIHNNSKATFYGWWKLNSKSHYCDPIAWMPLPEPYKGVTE